MSLQSDCDDDKCANFFNTVQKPFPKIEDGKINTLEFIEAAKGVVILVEKLGSVFAPVKYDMNGNVEKILKRYDLDSMKNETLRDMVLNEKAENSNIATDALMWLTRALHFIELFLEQILNKSSENVSENLTKELTHAYSHSVKPYHSWMTQKLFFIVCRMCPNRTQLFNSLEMTNQETFLKNLESFTQSLKANRVEIQTFYAAHGLENDKVV